MSPISSTSNSPSSGSASGRHPHAAAERSRPFIDDDLEHLAASLGLVVHATCTSVAFQPTKTANVAQKNESLAAERLRGIVGALGDGAADPGAREVREPRLRATSRPRRDTRARPGRSSRVVPVERDLERAVESRGMPHAAHEVPAGAARDHGELDVAARSSPSEPVDDLVDRAVAADDDEQLRRRRARRRARELGQVPWRAPK